MVSDGVDLDGVGLGDVDLGGVVAYCSMGGLALERIREVAVDSHMDVAACDSLGGQVGTVMVHGEMGGLDRPYAYAEDAEVVDSKSG